MYPKRSSNFENKNYTWCCGENALRSARAAIFGILAGDKSQKRGDKSRQPFTKRHIARNIIGRRTYCRLQHGGRIFFATALFMLYA